jgi:hypothetical protein
VDLDFVMLEYNHGKPAALVEYKERRAREPDTSHATYKALTALADGYADGSLPCFIAVYCADTWKFRVVPLNEAARAHFAHVEPGEWLTEQRFVTGLHLLRKQVLTRSDREAIAQLSSDLGDEDETTDEVWS